MTPRKPWPAWAAGEYHAIVQGARKLSRMAKVALERGIGGHRNVPLLTRLLPLMAGECRNIHLACQRVQAQRRGERWPKWAVQALEETAVLAARATALAEQAAGGLEAGHWPRMENGVSSCLRAGQEIERRLLAGPPPEVEAVLGEAETIAERRLEAAWGRERVRSGDGGVRR
jgi:hypothetical protein